MTELEDHFAKLHDSGEITTYQFFDLKLKLEMAQSLQSISSQMYQLVDIYSQEKGYNHHE